MYEIIDCARKYVLILSFLKINYRTQKQEIEKNKSTKRVSNSFQYTHCVRTEIFATIFYSLMQSLSLLEFQAKYSIHIIHRIKKSRGLTKR